MSIRQRALSLILVACLGLVALLTWRVSGGRAQETSPTPTVGIHPAAAELPGGTPVFAPLIIRDPTPTPEPTALPTLVPSPSPPPTSSVAVTSVYGLEMGNVARAATLIDKAPPTWVRRNALLWHDVEPTEGVRNWSAAASLETEFVEAERRQIKIILIVRGTPTWARKYTQSTCGPIKADKLQAFANFMRDAVARYSVAPYNVRYWEIWNEPDSPVSYQVGQPWGCWGEASDTYYGAKYYADMLKIAYPKMKAANPDIQVMIGGLLANCDPVNPPAGANCKQSKWFDGLLVNGAGPYFDGVSFHTYDYYYSPEGRYGSENWHSAWNTTGPLLVVKGRYLKSILQKHGVTGKFIVDTEMGLLCSNCQASASYEATKAYYIAQAYAAAMAEGFLGVTWYSIEGWLGTELLDGNNTPKPGFAAFQTGRSVLGGAVYEADLTTADVGTTGIKGYKFTRDGHDVWILWSLNGNTRNVQLPRLPDGLIDALGVSYAPTSTFSINLKPMYVQFPVEP